jgi:hypothetical protein
MAYPEPEMALMPSLPRRWRVRRWFWFALGAAGAFVLVLGALALAASIPFSSETLRQRVIATLSDRLDSDVELTAMRLRLLPRFHAEGVGLTLRRKDEPDLPPLISIKTLTVDASLSGLLRKHVSHVTVHGLEIQVRSGDRERRDRQVETSHMPRAASSIERGARDVVIDTLMSSDARLVIIPREVTKQPKVWSIHHLQMHSLSFDRAMPFTATLTNGIPPGEIATQGIFGPWHPSDPGQSPLEGTFTFEHADLSVFTGISGVLAAHGEFGGSLDQIEVHGETETPDFTLAISRHPVALHTDYHSTVDGLNGDTRLDRIDARFLHTALVAKGSVVDTPGKDGHTVTLDVSLEKARLEDVLRLAIKATKPPMTGGLKMTARLVIPPGTQDVADKLGLSGQFAVARATFTEIDIQQKIEELSRRSRGQALQTPPQRVVSNFDGRFDLKNARLTLRPVTFSTPGATVELAGTYQLRPETLNFTGTLSMAAKVSQTQTGFKRFVLKAIDPLFNKNGGGSVIPIKVEGTRNNPQFGLDRRRLFRRNR